MISKRIREIGKLIDNSYSVIDIGCDHGYLAQVLREKGNKNLIICSDEKKGPLDNARKNLVYYSDIEYCLSDGVQNISKQVDVAVMAGMGHNTVEHIINQKMDYFRNCKQIIIEVNTQVDEMRKWLMENDFIIKDETVVFDYKYYEILVVENGKQLLNENEIQFGPVLLKKRTDTYIKYWNHTKEKLAKIVSNLPDENHPDAKQLNNKIQIIEEMLNEK